MSNNTHPTRLAKAAIEAIPCNVMSVTEQTECQLLYEAMQDMAVKAAKNHEAHSARLKDALDAKPQDHDHIMDRAEAMRYWHDMLEALTTALERMG